MKPKPPISPRDWLPALTRAKASGRVEPTITDNPYVDVINAEPWTMATDGCALIAVKGDAAPLVWRHHPVGRLFDEARPKEIAKVDMERLREWTGIARHTKRLIAMSDCTCRRGFVRCNACQGEGTCKCACGDVHLCKRCKGDSGDACERCYNPVKFQQQDTIANGRVLFGNKVTRLIDRHLLGRYLRFVQAKQVQVWPIENGMAVDGGDWRVFIMGLNTAKIEEAEVKRWPTFKVAGTKGKKA